MFTGIITDLGRVAAVEPAGGPGAKGGDRRFVFATGYDTEGLEIGASVACSGACLTVVETGPGWFASEASAETLARTTLGSWRADSPVNFERALRLGDELGGHLVAGHVDGVARVLSRRPEGGSLRFVVEAPEAFNHLVAPKGSVALDGVSLTVNEVDNGGFGINVISHTAARTTFGRLEAGDKVNFEADLLARYVARLLQKD